MAYSYDQIIQAYTALNVGKAPNAATADSLRLTASLNASGQVSDAQVLTMLINGADSTTAVAVMSYQFFTGKSPTAAGLTYLVNSPINTNDLNDGYYAKFNLENRYINFAANLGLYGEGSIAFASKYGAMDFKDYVASIYETIIGRSYAEAASINVDAAISYLIGTRDAVLQTVREAGLVTANSSAAQVDLAVKAAMAGLVMAASIKADVGLYAAATDNFMVALTQGNAIYNTNITQTYKPSYDTPAHGTGHAIDRAPVNLPNPVTDTPVTAPVTSFTLGAGANNITGSSGNDTFTTTSGNLHSGDTLNGGSGNDVLNFTLSSGLYVLPAVTVSSIETVNANVTGNFRAYNWSGWTGMTSLNLTGIGVAVMDIQSIPTSANVTLSGAVYGSNNTMISGGHNTNVTVTSDAGNGSLEVDYNTGDTHITRTNTGAGTHANISVNGTGGNAYITQVADLTGIGLGGSQANGAVGFGGSTTSTSVEIVNPTPVAATVGTVGITGAGLGITDYNSYHNNGLLGSLTTIKVDGFTAPGYAFMIQDNALTNLSIAHGTGRVYLDNSTAVAGSPTTLNLAVNAVNVDFWEQGIYTTLNVTTGATASTISDLQMAALTTLNVSGSSNLNLSSLSNASSLHTATVTGAASLTATFGAGNDTITLGAGASVIDTGAGADHVIVTAANAASNTVFSTLNLSPGGDTLKINAQGGAAAFTGVMGASATGATFQDLLNSAASGDGHTTSQWGTFQFGGDTYIVLDSSASATFQAGTDIVVKLVGAYNEIGATITNGVLTIQ